MQSDMPKWLVYTIVGVVVVLVVFFAWRTIASGPQKPPEGVRPSAAPQTGGTAMPMPTQPGG